MKRNLSPEDYEFMNSLSAATAENIPKKMRWVLYFWIVAIGLFITWASVTEIDEITRGSGEVVPSGQNQMIQNLEGGIIEEVLVKVGDIVKKGQPLVKIDNQKSEAQADSIHIKALELKAKIIRLEAEANDKEFVVNPKLEKKMPQLFNNERSLYLSRKRHLNAKIDALNDKKNQKELELKETKDSIVHLKRTVRLMKKEISMMKPMVKQGIKSKVSFMKLQREESKIMSDLSSAKNAIPRIKASINEVQNHILVEKINFINEVKKELNEVIAEEMRVKENNEALDDQIERTLVKSPMNGIVQTLYVHTIGGVVKPGEDLIEIVPTDDVLWLEIKIKPSDIAFIYPGQKAIVKVSAYDFSIYGSLDGEVVYISADTKKDKKENSFYTIHVKTTKNHLGTEQKPLKIIPGMVVNIDILTGKKTVMGYILKPILKAKQYTFTER